MMSKVWLIPKGLFFNTSPPLPIWILLEATDKKLIKNNKKDAVSLTLKDQYPVSTDKDIEIELLQSDKAKINEETGILTWEVDLKAGESKKIRLSYKVKYPKNKFIENL